MVLCVLSFIVSDYSFDIFKLFLALKSTTETIGSKVPERGSHLVKYQNKNYIRNALKKMGLFGKF
jgi:hypothetical protein